MIRIVTREINIADAAHVGGPVQETLRTFDVSLPDVEIWLRDNSQWQWRRVIGIELLDERNP